MRDRKVIYQNHLDCLENQIKPPTVFILEVLLDIRELLQGKEEK